MNEEEKRYFRVVVPLFVVFVLFFLCVALTACKTCTKTTMPDGTVVETCELDYQQTVMYLQLAETVFVRVRDEFERWDAQQEGKEDAEYEERRARYEERLALLKETIMALRERQSELEK